MSQSCLWYCLYKVSFIHSIMRTGGDKQNNGEGTFAVGKSCAVVFGIKIKLLCYYAQFQIQTLGI